MKGKKKRSLQTKAVKTLVDGIQFQSKIEAYTYLALKKAGIEADYEKHSYILIQGFTSDVEVWANIQGVFRGRFNKIRPIVYTPDFVDPHQRWIIEVKGRKFADFMMRWKLFIGHLTKSEINSCLYLVCNKAEVDSAIKDIKQQIQKE